MMQQVTEGHKKLTFSQGAFAAHLADHRQQNK